MKNNLRKITLLGVEITNSSESEVLEYIEEAIQTTEYKGYVVTPNPEMVVLAQKDPFFKQVLNNAQLSVPDGVGLLLAARLLKKELRGRITGTDLLLKLCSKYNEKPVKLGFLGGRPHIAEETVKCLLETYPGLLVSFVSDEWTRQGFANARLLQKKHDEKIGKTSSYRETAENESIDILFIAYGFPKQEYFMAENLVKMPVKLAMGVGGAFDYISGDVVRAPSFVRALGFEWLFRLIRQPWRIKRQVALLQFLGLVLTAMRKS